MYSNSKVTSISKMCYDRKMYYVCKMQSVCKSGKRTLYDFGRNNFAFRVVKICRQDKKDLTGYKIAPRIITGNSSKEQVNEHLICNGTPDVKVLIKNEKFIVSSTINYLEIFRFAP